MSASMAVREMAVAGISVNRSTDLEKQNLGVSGTPGPARSPMTD